jgi:hypothetical protein
MLMIAARTATRSGSRRNCENLRGRLRSSQANAWPAVIFQGDGEILAIIDEPADE